jgi:fermentation-respiration switch protein FrsA (DUF1100 family)
MRVIGGFRWADGPIIVLFLPLFPLASASGQPKAVRIWGMLRPLLSLLLFAAGAWALLALLMFAMQSRLLFQPTLPGRALVGTPADLGLAFQELRLPTADGTVIHGWYVPPPPGGSGYSLLHLHGNAGNISHRLEWLRILQRAGVGVLLLEYRGYGLSEGEPSEDGLHLDAQAGWDWLRSELELPSERILLFGESLGGAVAARLATEVEAAGLVLFSAFTSVPDVAAHHYRWLPVHQLARIWFPTVDYLPGVQMPVLLMHSPDDEIVPVSHAHALLQVAPEPRFFIQTVGDHNGGFLQSESLITEGLRAFIALLQEREMVSGKRLR